MNQPPTPVDPAPARAAGNPHLLGLAGVLLGIVAVALMLWGLHLHNEGLVVDPAELALSETSPCIIQAVTRAQAGGHQLTYGELRRLKQRCGS